jgi:hypothetical protein
MIRIRIKENDTIQYEKEQYEYNKQNRHNAVVKSFALKNGVIDFFNTTLNSRMIPKKHEESFYNIPFKQIITDSKNSLFFQDPNNTLLFLKYNDGWIQSTTFDELTEDDDIVIFDDNEKEWAISGISELKTINSCIENSDINLSTDLQYDMMKNFSESLSHYMISMNNGLIINNILVL